jgi:hypothetical protein
MTKALALRPKGKHPLHVLWEHEVWPGGAEEANAPAGLREKILSGLPRMERAGTAWSTVGLRSDKVLQEIFHTEEQITAADVPRLCCSLPGIEGCLVSRRREVLAAWSIPLDLKQTELLDAASGAMDRAIDTSLPVETGSGGTGRRGTDRPAGGGRAAPRERSDRDRRRELTALERTIARLDAEKRRHHEALLATNDPAVALEVHEALVKATAALEAAEAQWLALAEEAGETRADG